MLLLLLAITELKYIILKDPGTLKRKEALETTCNSIFLNVVIP